MRITFYSNFLNPHQLPLCQALYQMTNGLFTFVATTQIPRERLNLGYPDMNCAYPFVLRTYEGEEQKNQALQLAEEADVVIHGSAPWFYLEERLKKGKLTFLYSERIYKTGYERWKWPVRMVRFFKKYGRYKNLYLLCASAYTAADFAKTWTFLNKTYKWGYFPEVNQYDNIAGLLEKKMPNSILWVGRFIDCKHPEYVIEVAKRLKAEGYDFLVKMLGNGALWDHIGRMIRESGLENQVQLIGAVPSDQVRGYMEASSIYLFTSDRNEGWGAVLNESMNSGCAVVACDAIGSVPFLLKDGENGMTYDDGDVEQLYSHVKTLLNDPERCRTLGRKAYETMAGQWNAETVAKRLLELSQALLAGNARPDLYDDGPCSKAEIIKDR